MSKVLANSEEYMMGRKFGMLTVIGRGEEHYFPNGRHRDRWICKCECGNVKSILGPDLRNNSVKSCGCLLKKGTHTTHGYSSTRLYKEWSDMKSRCYSEKNKRYKRYGGRGIKVCDKWKNSFNAFKDWALSHGYNDNLTIDRINTNGDYTPENCRYISVKSQMNNMSRNRKIEFNGEVHTVSEWEDITGIKSGTIRARLDRFGWNVEKALTKGAKYVC